MADKKNMLHSEMMHRMPQREFRYWVAFYQSQLQPEAPKEQTPEQILATLDMMAARRAKH